MKQPKIPSEEAVKKATTKAWQDWFRILDKAGAKDWPHKQIARWLWDNYAGDPPTAKRPLSGWWCQSVTVAYEYHHGKRVVGETADAGFEVGVQKVLPIDIKKAWALLTTPPGLEIWLGHDPGIKFENGYQYETKNGIKGEMRRVYKHEKLRLTYQSVGRQSPTTLQIYLSCPRNRPDKTMINFHQEKLANATERAKMKKHWQSVLAQLSKIA